MPTGVFERTEEHKKHIGEANKGIERTPEWLENMSKSRKGVPWRDPDGSRRAAHIKRMTENSPVRGRKCSDEQRAKMSAAKKGLVHPLLKAKGITQEQYDIEMAAGNRWCFHSQHFAPSSGFSGKGVCSGCNSSHNRASDLKKKFNVDHAWYEAKLIEQKGACALCGITTPSEKDKHFGIDHDHATGAVRGLLCAKCNMSLERFESVENWPMKVYAYLARYAVEKRKVET